MSGLVSSGEAAVVEAEVRRGVRLVAAMYGLRRALAAADTRSSDAVDFRVDFAQPLPHARDGSHRVFVQLYRTVPRSLHRAGRVTTCVEAVFDADYSPERKGAAVRWRHVEPHLAHYVIHPASHKLLLRQQQQCEAEQGDTCFSAHGGDDNDAVPLQPRLVMRLLSWVMQARGSITTTSDGSVTSGWETPFLRDLAWLLRGWRTLELDLASLDFTDDTGSALVSNNSTSNDGGNAAGNNSSTAAPPTRSGSRATLPRHHPASYHEARLHDVMSRQSAVMMTRADRRGGASASFGEAKSVRDEDPLYDFSTIHLHGATSSSSSSLRVRPLYRMATPASMGTSSVLVPTMRQPMALEASQTMSGTTCHALHEDTERSYVFRTYNNIDGSSGVFNENGGNTCETGAMSMAGTMAAATTTRIMHSGGSGVMSTSAAAAAMARMRAAAAQHRSSRYRPFAALLLPRGAVIAYGMADLVQPHNKAEASDHTAMQLTAVNGVRMYVTSRVGCSRSTKCVNKSSPADHTLSITHVPLPSLIELSLLSPRQARCEETLMGLVRRSAQVWREFTLYVSESQPHRALRANVALCERLQLRHVAHLLQVLCRLARGLEQIGGITATAYVADTLLPVLHRSVIALQESRQPFWAGVAVCCLALPDVLAMTAEGPNVLSDSVELQRPLLTQMRAESGRLVVVVRLLERVLELNAAYSQMCEARLVRIALEPRRSTTPALAATITRPSNFAQTAMTRLCAVCGLSLQPTSDEDASPAATKAVDPLQTLKTRVTEGCLVVRCARCGHGGHVEHLIDWWKDTTVRCCPKGCDCVCLY